MRIHVISGTRKSKHPSRLRYKLLPSNAVLGFAQQSRFARAKMNSSDEVDTSKIDFYEFLSLPAGPSSTLSEIKRAGRKTSLLYHPDKVAPTPENLQNFHLLQIAIAVLNDPAEKAKYDQTREAKLRRKAEVEALDQRRRKMRDDLEAREKAGANANFDTVRGQKRTLNQREMDIRRIAEENRRKMELLAARRKAEQQEVTEKVEKQPDVDNDKATALPEEDPRSSTTTDTENSIKLRWIREGPLEGYDEQSIQELFPLDDIDHVILLKDKKRKVEGREKKMLMGTAVIGFVSRLAAQSAMDKKLNMTEFESVEWA